MKPIIKIRLGLTREVIQWLVRFIIIGIIIVLAYKIYPLNPFFVLVFGGILLIFVLIIAEEKIVADNDVLILSKLFCFNLIKVKKVIRIDKMKNIIIAGNNKRTINIWQIILPYAGNAGSANEIRIIYKSGDLTEHLTAIYLDDLSNFENQIKDLISEKNKPNSFSQPYYKED